MTVVDNIEENIEKGKEAIENLSKEIAAIDGKKAIEKSSKKIKKVIKEEFAKGKNILEKI